FRSLIEGAAVPAVSADTAIVDLRALDARPAGGDGAADVESDAERVSTGLTELVQQLARAGAAPRLNIVTRRAVAAVPGDSASGVAESAAWGIGKVVALEHPELNARLIDIDGASDASALIDVIEVGNEPQVAI